jgi:hypothetical protein
MTCRDFERGWNELLDAGGPAIGGVARPGPSTVAPRLAVTMSMSDLELTLRDHAADCPACRQVATRYQLLHRALGAWNAQPAAPIDLADRILVAAQSPASTRWGAGMRSTRPIWRIGLPLATAAAAAVALVFVRPTIDGPRPDRRTTVPPLVARNIPRGAVSHSDSGPGTVSADTRALNTALADATAATWDLARSASEPAARISRQVLDAATGPEPASVDDGSGSFSVSISSYVPTAPDSAAASAMLRQVGDSLATSVGPLSTTARHAFGFLLVPALAKPEVRHIPPAAKGA